jgi:small-conductance mechanosensitive channel
MGIGYEWDGQVCHFDPWRSHLSSIPVVMLNCRLPIIQLLFGDMQFRALLLMFIAQACLPFTLTGVWWRYIRLKKPWFDNESNANQNYPWTCTWFIWLVFIYACKAWFLFFGYFPVALITTPYFLLYTIWIYLKLFKVLILTAGFRIVGFLGLCATLAEIAAPIYCTYKYFS